MFHSSFGNAFGIDFQDSDLNKDGDFTDTYDLTTSTGDKYKRGEQWSSDNRQIALLGAVLTERAFRNAATQGQLADLPGFGQAFSTLMGPIHMTIGALDKVDNRGAETSPGRGSSTIEWYRNVSTARTGNDRTNHLGLTPNDISSAHPNNISSAMLFNVIHEFGHVFDGRARSHGRVDTQQAERTGALPADEAMDGVMGIKQRTFNTHLAGEEFADLFLNFVTNRFANNAGGEGAQQWFTDHLFGDTSPGSMPQVDWGWADIARDRARGENSRWVTYEDSFRQGIRPVGKVTYGRRAFGCEETIQLVDT